MLIFLGLRTPAIKITIDQALPLLGGKSLTNVGRLELMSGTLLLKEVDDLMAVLALVKDR